MTAQYPARPAPAPRRSSSLYPHRIRVHRLPLPPDLASSLEEKQRNPITVFPIISPPHTMLGNPKDSRMSPTGTFRGRGHCRGRAGPLRLQSG